MLPISDYMQITGTFVSCLLGDTGINNWGLNEWNYEFRLYKALGIDTIVIINCEVKLGGVWRSGLDPRSVTWPEDQSLLDMFFRLSEKYEMKVYLGGSNNLDNLYKGYWRQDIEDNRIFYERMLEKFGDYECFYGLYYTIEALPWHFNFCDIAIGIAEVAHNLAPNMKKLFSPTLFGITGAGNNEHYSLADFEKLYGDMLQGMKGHLDYCAWQDKYYLPNCRMGNIEKSELDTWHQVAKQITERIGAEYWVNVETFQRSTTTTGAHGDYRQIDYRSLAAKLQSAKHFAKKIITYEFSTCMSPNAEWGSSERLLKRYLEMMGMDIDLADIL